MRAIFAVLLALSLLSATVRAATALPATVRAATIRANRLADPPMITPPSLQLPLQSPPPPSLQLPLQPPPSSSISPPLSPAPQISYLLANAPVFDLTIGQFRASFNRSNPQLALTPFRSIKPTDNGNLVRAASPINHQLYASTALESGTLKIKSMQITWLADEQGQRPSPALALAYMSALMRFFSPGLSQPRSMEQLTDLLKHSENQRYYTQTAGAVRYVLVTGAENALTFAVEPIKLGLSGTLLP